MQFIPENLTLALRVAGLTQEDLAAAIGTDKRVIGHYSQGRKNPSPRRLAQISEALGIEERSLSDPDLREKIRKVLKKK